MKRKRLIAGLALVVLLAFALTLPILAQIGGGFDLSWNGVDGGGATFSTGGGYTLGGTIGQADAAGGGNYTLTSGFWAGTPTLQPRLYLPLVTR